MKNLNKALIVIFFLFIAFSCKKEDAIIDDPSAQLIFSSDTILFDTVFTTVGSTTKYFTIHNPHNKTLRISKIRLARGGASFFRLNLDGVAGTEFTNIDIPKKDSLFMFIEVTVDPTNQNNPLIIRDSIEFMVNGKLQDVDLEAWGQDAYYHKPTVFPTNGFPNYSIICPAGSTLVWTNDKPHVIYGYAVVDSAGILQMQAGTRVHLHNNAVLWIYNQGSLQIQGANGNPVIIQGDRLEPQYSDVPGQWGKIWLSALSKNNTIDWAVIKNGSIGLQADTVDFTSGKPTLSISNSIVKNMSAAALYAQGAIIRGNNCVFANCGQYTAALTIGGLYSFKHCTFANYWSNSNRRDASLLLNNYYVDINNVVQVRHLDSAYFGNCVIYGSEENEILYDSSSFGGNFNVFFEHSLLKIDPELKTNSAFHYKNIIKNQGYDPGFESISENNYNLTTGSVLINKGNASIGNMYPNDLNGNPRNIDAAPDLGAYELK